MADSPLPSPTDDDEGVSVAQPARKKSRKGAVSVDTRGVSAGTGSVCKLFVKRVESNYADPWRRRSQGSATGTGFLVEGKWIVTNAHVVHRAVSILVRATTGPPIKYSAKVLCVGVPCDLAVLEVSDPKFWEGKDSLKLSDQLPRLDDNATCVGFPMGGDNICVTRGVVSRIDVNDHGLLRIQIDAAINPGNSGGPVLGQHGLVVGVATSHLKNASNIGYIIPTSVLQQFLECCRSGYAYRGVASLGIARPQTLESTALRKALKLKENFTGGVRISAVWPLGPANDLLRIDDVLLAIDDVEIGQDATVPLRDNERIHFMHLVTRRLAGRDSAAVRVLREGEEIHLSIPLMPDRWLVPRYDNYDAAPEYVIVGGLVFVPLSRPWAETKRDERIRSLLVQKLGLPLPEEGKQAVILSKVLAHPCNVGYHSLGLVVLESFNSAPVHNLAQLAQAVAKSDAELLVFEFARTAGHGKDLVILNREECNQAEEEIRTQHLIASPCMVREDGLGEPRPLSDTATAAAAASSSSAASAPAASAMDTEEASKL
mmetsp:Transcript_43452/g.93594  ORF Transcript_43452/g.93594 Transcript_43452/m.93594 type:complete len:544 (+) Transcript_43452:156-1787(+)